MEITGLENRFRVYWDGLVSESMSSLADLPEHLLEDILRRLPISSIIRFGCVCKSWYSLIRNPNFLSFHFEACKNNQQPQLLVHKYHLCLFDSISLLFDSGDCFQSQPRSQVLKLPRFIDFRVAGSCNGILCFVYFGFDPSNFMLLNPSINHSLWLPRSGRPVSLLDKLVGFGFDVATKDFKILKVYFVVSESDSLKSNSWRDKSAPISKIDHICVSEIYSLNSNSWRDISVPTPKIDHTFNTFGAFVNGALHWVVRINDTNLIFVFDVKDETFRTIALPSCYINCNPHRKMNVIEFGECSIVVTHSEAGYETDVWVMQEYGLPESWMKLATIGKPWRGYSDVLGFRDKDQVFFRIGSRKLALQKVGKRVKNLMAVSKGESFSLHKYVPSLFLLDKKNNTPA